MKKLFALILVLVLAAGTVIVLKNSDILPNNKLSGSWRDSTGMCGYTFKEDGTVEINYANFTIPVINMNYNGKLDGTYTTMKDEEGNRHLTISFTVFFKTVTIEYLYKVEKNSLSLTVVGSDNTLVLIRQNTKTAETSTSAASAAA